MTPEDFAKQFTGVRFLGLGKSGEERFECSKQIKGVRPTRVVKDRGQVQTVLTQLPAIANMMLKQSDSSSINTTERPAMKIGRTGKTILLTKKGKKVWTIAEAAIGLKEYYKAEQQAKKVTQGALDTKFQSINAVKLHLASLLPLGADTPMSEVADDDVIADLKDYYRDELGIQDKTADKRLSTLNMMFKVARQKRHLDIKYSCDRYNVESGNIAYLKDHQVNAILEHFEKVKKNEHAEVARCLVDIGCRQDDLWRITENDVDFSRPEPTVYIHASKHGLDREIKISELCLPIFKRRITGNPKIRVFPYNNDWFRNAWKPMRDLMEKSDDSTFTPHILRHTCGSRLAQDNMSPQFIKNYLGHKSIQATYKYMHLAPKNMDECVDAINRRNGSAVVKDNKTNELLTSTLTPQQLEQVAKLISTMTANQQQDTKDV